MRYEFKRLELIGALYPDHPNHDVRYVALKDAAVALPGIRTVLVLGCGRGIVEYLLTDGWKITSVDISEMQIEAARGINRYKRNRHFLVGDAFKLAEILGNQSFDVVIISEMIEHVQDDAEVLRIAYARLAPRGYLLLTVPNLYRFHNALNRLLYRPLFLMTSEHYREYQLKSVIKVLQSLGFDLMRWRGVWFEFPRPGVMERFIGPTSLIRRMLAALFPRWATYLLFVCRKP